MTDQLYPLLFTPVLKDYIWGGRNLAAKLGRDLPPDQNIAESWEIAAHPDGTAVVSNGRFAGQPLTELHQQLGLDLIGSRNQWAQERDKFPLLIKLLDANKKLSVQVHPNDDYALAHEGNELGKTEMWVVLAAGDDAGIIYGVTEGTTRDNFRQAITDGNLEPHLHSLPVSVGDVVCVPAGTLHAILGGLIIAEIQQNSNTTYRVYDWNRLRDGQPRPLHVDKALDVINFDQIEPTLPTPQKIAELNGVTRYRLCQNRYFVTERVEMDANAVFSDQGNGETLEIWGLLAGATAVSAPGGSETLTPVQFTLLPAAIGDFTVQAQRPSTLLRTYVPA